MEDNNVLLRTLAGTFGYDRDLRGKDAESLNECHRPRTLILEFHMTKKFTAFELNA